MLFQCRPASANWHSCLQFQQGEGVFNEHGNQAILSILLDMVTQLQTPRVCDEIVFSYLFTSSPAAEGNSCMSLIHCISTPLKWCTKFSLRMPLGGTTNCGFTEKSLGQMQWWANVHDSETVTCPKQLFSMWESKGCSQRLTIKETKILFDQKPIYL